MNSVIELLHRHRSVRRFTADGIPDADVRAAVDAGQRASTSSVTQSYCLVRVRTPATRAALVPLTGDQAMVADAPAFFVVCGDTRRHRLAAALEGRPYDTRLEAFLVATVDATLFAQNVAIAFESMGYGICFVGGLRNHLPEVDRLLALPEGVYPLFGLCVGRPAEDPVPKPRLPLAAVLCEDGYPDDATMLALLEEHEQRVSEYANRRGRDPGRWTTIMAGKFAAPRRIDLAAYYASKGADLR